MILRTLSLSLLLSASMILSIQGCAIFSVVTDPIAQGYRNTVAYFNVYYNAKRLFDEAETEIRDFEKTNRGKSNVQPGIPAATKQKLNVVIDKCSNILAFHSESSLVDDALLLVGKSYYYQREFVKAERKFAELLAQYPTSGLILETERWFLQTLAQLGRHEDVIEQAPNLITAAEIAKERDIVGAAYALMGDCYGARGETEQSIQYYELAVEHIGDDDARSRTLKTMADLLLATGNSRAATSAYLKLSKTASDPYWEYYGLLQSAKSYRLEGNYDASLRLVDELLDNFLFNQYRDVLLLERARVFAQRGDNEDALAEYMNVDTTFARSESGARAAFERAVLLEASNRYEDAMAAYGRAASGSVPELSVQARKKGAALAKYFSLTRDVAKYDSLRTVALRPPAATEDSVQSTSVNIEDVDRGIAKTKYELGELFYSDLGHVDSSVFYNSQALELRKDSILTPRALFVLADISRLYPDKSPKAAEEWHGILADWYPESPYGKEAKRILGLATATTEADPAEEIYKRGELMIEQRKYEEAIGNFHQINDGFQSSPYAAKSLYTIGWIYEHRLLQPDSALSYYKSILERYSSTPYAVGVRSKIEAEPSKNETPVDTTVVAPAAPREGQRIRPREEETLQPRDGEKQSRPETKKIVE